MTEEQKRTPGEWYVEIRWGDYDDGPTLYLVRECLDNGSARDIAQVRDEEQAQLIVKAVNAYPKVRSLIDASCGAFNFLDASKHLWIDFADSEDINPLAELDKAIKDCEEN